MVVQASLSRGFISNTMDNPKNETFPSTEMRNQVGPLKPKVSKENKEYREVEKIVENKW